MLNDTTYHPFVRWDTPHLWALGLTIGITALLLIWGARQKEKTRFWICRGLAILLALQLASEFIWRHVSHEYSQDWRENLPLHFCSIMIFVAIYGLWTRARWACAICFFGILTLSLQALITPSMANGYPSMAFYVFFLSHGLLFLVGLAIPILMKWRARGWDDLKSVLYIDVYLLSIIPINIWLDTNYGYTQAAPFAGSALDFFGTAPWYYLWLQLPVWGIFRLLYLFVHDKKSEKINNAPQVNQEPAAPNQNAH